MALAIREHTMWTEFDDMFSGGSQKLKWETICIEAGIDEAVCLFIQIFDRDPFNVTCECCGSDYSITSSMDSEISLIKTSNRLIIKAGEFDKRAEDLNDRDIL